MNVSYISTKIGRFRIEDDGVQIQDITFFFDQEPLDHSSPLAEEMRRQIEAFYQGRRKNYTLPFEIKGTEFQRAVLIEMTKIPYGSTISYLELAQKVGYPNAQRAVGSVCSHNNLPLLIPCHRVIKNDGSIGKYGGRSDIKSMMIQHEKNTLSSLKREE